MVLKRPEIAKTDVAEVEWFEFLDNFHRLWDKGGEGQHVSAIGRTRSGKTTAITQVLDGRRYNVVLLTKLRDPLFAKFKARGYKIVKSSDDWPSREWHPKIAIHIPAEGLDARSGKRQADLIRTVLYRVWHRGDVDLYIDEIAELSDLLGLKTELRAFYKEAGSSNVSLWAGTQRGAWVPREMYDQPRFLFLWHTANRDELKKIADMAAGDPEMARQVVAQLDRFEVLVIDAWTGEMARTKPPKL